jgi:CDGSH-type Zn-finger protein
LPYIEIVTIQKEFVPFTEIYERSDSFWKTWGLPNDPEQAGHVSEVYMQNAEPDLDLFQCSCGHAEKKPLCMAIFHFPPRKRKNREKARGNSTVNAGNSRIS